MCRAAVVELDRAAHAAGDAELVVDAAAVVARRRIDIRGGCGHVGQPPAQAVAEGADAAVARGTELGPDRGDHRIQRLGGHAEQPRAFLLELRVTECAPRVRVNAIAVGATETSALETVLDDNLRSMMEAGTPLRRLGQPEDIAAGVLYLCSPAGSYLTGKILEIDGGLTAPNLALALPDL